MTLDYHHYQRGRQHGTITITNKTTTTLIIRLFFLRIITVILFVVYNNNNNIFANAYTIPQLQRLVKLSSLSYLPIEKIPSSPYFSRSRSTNDDDGDFNYQPLHQIVDPQTESGATIFFNHDNNDVVIACRGSATLKNFATNLNFELIPTDNRLFPLSNIPDGSRIHAGFQLASWGLWDGVHLGDYLLSKLRLNGNKQKQQQQQTVTFTGHSLGAATALLCAAHASNAGIACDVITFGGPRLCNGILARHLERNVITTEQGGQRTIVNMVHDADPILANNQVLWNSLGFEVVGKEVRCDPGMARVYDDEGEGRSWVPAWNFLDHCRYLGVFVGPRLT